MAYYYKLSWRVVMIYLNTYFPLWYYVAIAKKYVDVEKNNSPVLIMIITILSLDCHTTYSDMCYLKKIFFVLVINCHYREKCFKVPPWKWFLMMKNWIWCDWIFHQIFILVFYRLSTYNFQFFSSFWAIYEHFKLFKCFSFFL